MPRLISWEGAHLDEHLGQDASKVICLIHWRTNPSKIKEYVEQLYINYTASLSEKKSYLTNKNIPYPAKTHYSKTTGDTTISCWHNPYISARKVTNVKIKNKDSEIMHYTVNWKKESIK